MLGPILRGERLSLEPPRLDDLPIYRGWFAEPEVTRYLLARFAPSEKQEEEWYEKASTGKDQVVWRIAVGGRPIGTTSLFAIDWINRHAVSGLVIGERAEWGKGYASEAVRLRTAYAFRELGLERLESFSLDVNVAMHRALEKSGYQKIARRRRMVFVGGAWHDDFLFELLRDEWEAAHR
jgi:RimJ/RimL family protein N-acetyltransferase